MKPNCIVVAGLVFCLAGASARAQHGSPYTLPDAVVDLRTEQGVEFVRGQWRYADAKVTDVDHRSPGPDLKPSGTANRTQDITPQAGAPDFDDSGWKVIAPESLEQRRSTGRLCFNWYRIRLTIPEKVGDLSTAGCTAVFEVVVDDYAEVWVDGRLPQVIGQSGGQVVRGWNAPNRVVVGRDVRPGQQIQLAVFGMNAPLSQPPGNFIWVRSATLDFYKPGRFAPAEEVKLDVVRLDPTVDNIIPPSARLERIASGFGFTEGPVWVSGNDLAGGRLLFSDPNNNTIYQWSQDGEVSVFRPKSGYTGLDMGLYKQPGSNGLALDPQGRLTICEHGNRRVTRIEKNGVVTVLADRYEGKRLNSPNDLVYRSDGALFFTDPPFGLPKFHDDPRRELPFSGVFCLRDGQLTLISTDLSGPNGLALSPDERYLYVTNWDASRKVVMRYRCAGDGTLSEGAVFFDMTAAPGEEALDGVKIDGRGNLFVSGPGGLWVLSSNGKHLATIRTPDLPANMAWGGATGDTLYLTARTSVYRIQVEGGNAGSAGVSRVHKDVENTGTIPVAPRT